MNPETSSSLESDIALRRERVCALAAPAAPRVRGGAACAGPCDRRLRGEAPHERRTRRARAGQAGPSQQQDRVL